MAYTVGGAFSTFRSNTVDLEPNESDKARSSRDYMCDQLKTLGKDDQYFPKITNQFIGFGSFARKTKIRPLDDIDVLMLLDGSGITTRQSQNDPYEFWLYIDKPDAPLARFPDDYGFVNSTKVLNQIKSSLKSVANYYKADIKKNQQAVTLDLLSYTWVFDLVPAVPVGDGFGNTSYFLIPDGTGDWLRTNPSKDAEYITRVNQWHDGQFLSVMRLLKYWNRRTHKPRLMPYYFETLALKVFDYALKFTTPQQAIKYFFDNCSNHLVNPCPDPKGLGRALDADVDWDTKTKVKAAITEAATWADYAMMYETLNDPKNAIYWWGKVFGPEFPTYG
jgi:hypothetical protein